jgi:hypothetical protein
MAVQAARAHTRTKAVQPPSRTRTHTTPRRRARRGTLARWRSTSAGATPASTTWCVDGNRGGHGGQAQPRCVLRCAAVSRGGPASAVTCSRMPLAPCVGGCAGWQQDGRVQRQVGGGRPVVLQTDASCRCVTPQPSGARACVLARLRAECHACATHGRWHRSLPCVWRGVLRVMLGQDA